MRAAEAIAANPEKSDRAIAAEIGTSPTTIGKARAQLSTDGQLEDIQRIGLDGKTRRLPADRPLLVECPVSPAGASLVRPFLAGEPRGAGPGPALTGAASDRHQGCRYWRHPFHCAAVPDGALTGPLLHLMVMQ